MLPVKPTASCIKKSGQLNFISVPNAPSEEVECWQMYLIYTMLMSIDRVKTLLLDLSPS